MTESIYEILAKRIRKDQEELDAAENITKEVYPTIEKLERRDIVNPVILKIKLSEVDPKYRDGLYGLYRIAIDGGPEGSFIILDAQKVLVIVDDIEPEEEHDANEEDDDEDGKDDRGTEQKKNKKKKKKIIIIDGEEYIVDEEGNKTKKNKGDKKFIVGITAKVIHSIESFIIAELQALCHLVNESVLQKVINVPPYSVRGGKAQVLPLNKKDQEISR